MPGVNKRDARRAVAVRACLRSGRHFCRSSSTGHMPDDFPLHDLLPAIGATRGKAAKTEIRLGRRQNACVLVSFDRHFIDARLQAGILAKHADYLIALDSDARPPTARSPLALIIPFQEMQQ